MKEIRYFFVPDAGEMTELPADEAAHCVRVLRMQEGDEICLTDGFGAFYRAEITAVTNKKCCYRILEKSLMEKTWRGHLHIAMAPTKNNDRTEWFAEKAEEIGFDELTFLNCKFSERRVIKNDRIEKILVSAMKQSHKAVKPILNDMTDFGRFVCQNFPGQKFIAHCYDECDIVSEDKSADDKTIDGGKEFLLDVLDADQDALVLVGPEGDFSVEEVRLALSHGFRSVSLGKSRLRTETAALVAVHLMNLKHTI